MKKFIVAAFCVPFAFSIALAQRDVNQKDREGFTPLMRAADRGQLNVVRSLLNSGAAVDAKGKGGMTPLMLAARNGHLPVVKLLLESGANANVSVPTMETGEISVLIWGIMSGNQPVVQTLITNGAEVNPKTEDGATPLIGCEGLIQ